MALVIGIGLDAQSFFMRTEPIVVFNDDGYYWFLHPLFLDLAQETGQCVDLYDGASFAGPTLERLGDTLERAKRLIAEQPETWRVHIGTQTSPFHKELHSSVEKQAFQKLLDRLGEIVEIARDQHQRVVCLGD